MGGVVLTALGVAPGFLINAASFALVVMVLAKLQRSELSQRIPVRRESGQIRQGLSYVREDPVLTSTTIVMLVVFATSYNFQISLALIASETLAGDGHIYGLLMSFLGLGAPVGSLALARHARIGMPMILVWTCVLAVTQLIIASAQSLVPLLIASFAMA